MKEKKWHRVLAVFFVMVTVLAEPEDYITLR